jgi:hypothetical protein
MCSVASPGAAKESFRCLSRQRKLLIKKELSVSGLSLQSFVSNVADTLSSGVFTG